MVNALFPGGHAETLSPCARRSRIFCNLGAADYLTVQRNYDNWSIVGLRACCGNLSILMRPMALQLTRSTTPIFVTPVLPSVLERHVKIFCLFYRRVRDAELSDVRPHSGYSL
jgi:hypothetical protein